jgi:hypothetical protein
LRISVCRAWFLGGENVVSLWWMCGSEPPCARGLKLRQLNLNYFLGMLCTHQRTVETEVSTVVSTFSNG